MVGMDLLHTNTYPCGGHFRVTSMGGHCRGQGGWLIPPPEHFSTAGSATPTPCTNTAFSDLSDSWKTRLIPLVMG
jgi:hypothetical protein